MTRKKYSILVFVLLIISLFIFYKVDAVTNDLPLLGKIIFVDPGHGECLYPQRIKLCWNPYNTSLDNLI